MLGLSILRILFLAYVSKECVSQDPMIVMLPQNQASVQGETVTLLCQIQQNDVLTEYIFWDECITNGDGTCRRISNDDTIVYSALGGDPVRGARYSIDSPQAKQYNLKITGILPEDAGKYRCTARNRAIVYRDADIVVLGQEPACSRNTSDVVQQGDYVKMTCNVIYWGRWAPELNWKHEGQDYTGPVIDETVANDIRQSIVVQIQPSKIGDIFSMDTNFTDSGSISNNEADNRPSYRHTFQFEPLLVYHSPYDISVKLGKGGFQVGETISCSAVAMPNASYVWVDRRNSIVLESSAVLIFAENMLGFQTYMCTAYNQYGNDTVSVDIEIQKEEGNGLTVAVGFITALLVASVVANIVAILYIRGIICAKTDTTVRDVPDTTYLTPIESAVMGVKPKDPQYEDMHDADAVATSHYDEIKTKSDEESVVKYENTAE